MSTPILEAFLARLYVDSQVRERFINHPTAEAARAGLSPDEIEAVKQIDRVGLELFATSLELKRQRQYSKHSRRNYFWRKAKSLVQNSLKDS